MGYSLATLFFFIHSLVYELKGLLIKHSIADIWQKFGYGLQVKQKEKYLYKGKCTLQIILKNEVPGGNNLFKVIST